MSKTKLKSLPPPPIPRWPTPIKLDAVDPKPLVLELPEEDVEDFWEELPEPLFWLCERSPNRFVVPRRAPRLEPAPVALEAVAELFVEPP